MPVEYGIKDFKAMTADYAACYVKGTVIDKNAGRPKRDMPNIGDLIGSIARMGDEWVGINDQVHLNVITTWRRKSFPVLKMKDLVDEQKKERV